MELPSRAADAPLKVHVQSDEQPLLLEPGGGAGGAAEQPPWYKRPLVPWVLSGAGWLCFFAVLLAHAGGAPSAAAPPPSTAAAAASAPRLSFLVVGDWGRQGAYNGTRVAAAMGVVAAALRPRFVVSTGDNVYDQGIRNVSDPWWDATFSRVYTHPALALQWYAAMGNHDWYAPGNVSAQVDPALRRRDSRWVGLQAGTRSFYGSPGDATPLLTLVFVDTSPWLLSYRAKTGSMDWAQGGIAGVANAAYDSLAGRLAWAAWEDAAAAALEAQLQASTARWQIVVGHHPIYSYSGRHGSTTELARLNGILRRGGAHAYLNGHDHNLQLIVPPAPAWPGTADFTSSSEDDTTGAALGGGMAAPAGPLYLTSGAGSKCSDDVAPPPPDGSLLFAHGSQGFNSIELNATALRLLSYDVDGRVLHQYVQPWAPAPLCGATQDGLPGALLLRTGADPRCGPPPVPASNNAGFVPHGAASTSTSDALAGSGAAMGGGASSAPVPFDDYQLVGALQLPGGHTWDYVSYDAANQVVYLGRRADGLAYVDARDPANMRSMGSVPSTAGTNGVILLAPLGLGVSLSAGAALFTLPSAANGYRVTVLGNAVFDPSLGNPDGGAYLAQTQTVAFTFPHRPASAAGSVALFQLAGSVLSAAAARTSPPACGSACFSYASAAASAAAASGIFGGGLEAPFPTPDGASLWVMLEAGSIAVRVDGTTGATLQTIDLRTPGCANPAGSALDGASGVLFVGCRGGSLPGNIGWGVPLLLALNATTGAPLYTSRIGRHVDGVAYMPPSGGHTGRIFVSCGGDATLMVFEQLPPGAAVPFRPLEAISTRLGAKTLAVDPLRRMVFTAAPSGSANYRGKQLPPVAPGAAALELFYPNAWQDGTYTLLAYRALN